MEKYQKRIIEEYKNLNKKIKKLMVFITSLKAQGVEIQGFQKLKDQLNIMGQYSKILETRINNFYKKAPAILVKDGVMTTMSKDEEIQKLGQLLTATKIEDKDRLLSIVGRLTKIIEGFKEDTPPQGGSGVPSLFHDFFDRLRYSLFREMGGINE